VCRGYNSGFSSPATCDDGFDAAERLAFGKSSQAAMAARGPKHYEWNCVSRGDEWCGRYKPPPHVIVSPEHAVIAEIALFVGDEKEATPGSAWAWAWRGVQPQRARAVPSWP